jgi:hypothetical protein
MFYVIQFPEGQYGVSNVSRIKGMDKKKINKRDLVAWNFQALNVCTQDTTLPRVMAARTPEEQKKNKTKKKHKELSGEIKIKIKKQRKLVPFFFFSFFLLLCLAGYSFF